MFARKQASPIVTVEAEIAKLCDRQVELEAQLKKWQEAVERAAAERRHLFAATLSFDDPKFVEVKQSLEKAEARLRDLQEALELIASQRREAEERLALLHEQDARADEVRRVDQMLAEAAETGKALDKILTKFIASFSPLMLSGELAARAAAQFRTSAALLVRDAIGAAEEYRDAIASGERPLPTRVSAKTHVSSATQGSQ